MPGFVGDAEGNDIIAAAYDVIVTDGFTGNVTLKTIEGTSKALFSALKEVMTSSLKAKMGGLALKSDLKALKDSIMPTPTASVPGIAGISWSAVAQQSTAIRTACCHRPTWCDKDVTGLSPRRWASR